MKSSNYRNGEPRSFVSCREAVRHTGLSYQFLLSGCKTGKIPHIRIGTRYMVNLNLLMSKLDEMSESHLS